MSPKCNRDGQRTFVINCADIRASIKALMDSCKNLSNIEWYTYEV